MQILLSNDDGITSPGLRVLVDIFSNGNEVYVVAPDKENSAVSNAITISEPVFTEKVQMHGTKAAYKSSGTPADCVKLAICALNIKPDMVISGINQGQNCGIDITYSGTVAAASEGYYFGIPAFAVSTGNHTTPDFDACRGYLRDLVEKLHHSCANKKCLFNINVPSCRRGHIKGIKLTHQADSKYRMRYDKQHCCGTRQTWRVAVSELCRGSANNSDWHALENGYISATPLSLNLTDHDISGQELL